MTDTEASLPAAADTASTTLSPLLIRIPSPDIRVGIRPTTPQTSAATSKRQITAAQIQSDGLVMTTK